jgi:hypothetical protein
MPARPHSAISMVMAARTTESNFIALMKSFDPENTSGAEAAWQAMLFSAVEMYGDNSSSLKDIEATDITGFKEYFTAYISVMQSFIAQNNIRMHAPAVIGKIDTDQTITYTVYTSQDYMLFRDHLEMANLISVPWVEKFLYAINPILEVEIPNPEKRIPGSRMVLYCPHLTVTEMWTKLGIMETYKQDCMMFLSKMGLKWTKFLLPGPGPFISIDALANAGQFDYIAWLISGNYISRLDNAGTARFDMSMGNAFAGATSSATWFESVRAYFPGTTRKISPLWMLTRTFMIANAPNNDIGASKSLATCCGVTPGANNWYAMSLAIGDSEFAVVDEGDPAEDVFAIVNACLTDNTGGGTFECSKELGEVGHDYAVNIMQVRAPGIRYYTLSSLWLDEARFFLYLMKGGELRVPKARTSQVVPLTIPNDLVPRDINTPAGSSGSSTVSVPPSASKITK